MNKNTIYKRKSELDAFYTDPKIAKWCYDLLAPFSLDTFTLFLEPSAGNGSFYSLFPKEKRLGLDIVPQNLEIQKKDFFTFFPEKKGVVTIGNPPFGKNSSLSVKFFNHAAQFSDMIAFIVPKTFQKASIQNRLNRFFVLKLDRDLPKNSFLLNGEKYDVPCCFQVWEKTEKKRMSLQVDLKSDAFSFVKKEEANFALRRVGGRAGKATKDVGSCSQTTHYFLKTNFSPDWLIEKINTIDFTKISSATAGVRSLSKPEFVSALKKIL
ncbi:MAG: hypothetical protein QM536_09750 [Chitinophagaceae bacterium]|nr:hypothetical protein [Chitinophagaceae bacterium]